MRPNYSEHEAIIEYKNLDDWGDGEERSTMLCVIAENSTTPEWVLKEILESGDDYGISGLLANPNTPPDMLSVIAKTGEHQARIAYHDNCPTEVLLKIAESDDEEALEAVASNPNTPTETIREISKKIDLTEIYPWPRIVRNPNIPADLLELFAQSKEGEVREEVGMQPHTPPELLIKLAEDEDMYVRRGVAKNPNTPSDVVESLADSDK